MREFSLYLLVIMHFMHTNFSKIVVWVIAARGAKKRRSGRGGSAQAVAAFPIHRS
jgi:hypothetical protein